MKPIKATKNRVNIEQLIEIRPNADHVSRIIREATLVFVEGKVAAVYMPIPFDTKEIEQACKLLNYQRTVRTNGVVTRTVHLNASGRRKQLSNKCSIAKLRKEYPKVHELYMEAAREIAKYYRRYFKKQFIEQVKATYSGEKKVESTYRILKTPFTGGVINKNSAISYHYDNANTSNGISCMLIFKKSVAGGNLILPELNLGFECQDGYLLLFDGKKYLHGVTAIGNLYGDRYTIVYYNNFGMDICLPPKDEELHYQQHLEAQSIKKRNKLKENEQE